MQGSISFGRKWLSADYAAACHHPHFKASTMTCPERCLESGGKQNISSWSGEVKWGLGLRAAQRGDGKVVKDCIHQIRLAVMGYKKLHWHYLCHLSCHPAILAAYIPIPCGYFGLGVLTCWNEHFHFFPHQVLGLAYSYKVLMALLLLMTCTAPFILLIWWIYPCTQCNDLYSTHELFMVIASLNSSFPLNLLNQSRNCLKENLVGAQTLSDKCCNTTTNTWGRVYVEWRKLLGSLALKEQHYVKEEHIYI